MDLKHLRYFVAVADARSVGKAAMQLHMAQPPLSVHIHNLEAQLGTALFRRGPRGMELTDAGGALYSRAKEALALAHDGFEAARAVAAGRRGRLTVGYMFALGYAVLPKLVPELRRTLSGVDIQFVEMSASTYEMLISEFKVTVGLCMPPLQRSGIATVTIGKQPLLLAMPARSPLARHKVVPMAKLQGMKLVGLPSTRVENGADTSPIGSLLRRHHITAHVMQRVETVHSALALVLAGEGFSIVPACAALGSPPGVSFRPLEDDGGGMEMAVCWRQDLDNPLVKPFISAVQAAMA